MNKLAGLGVAIAAGILAAGGLAAPAQAQTAREFKNSVTSDYSVRVFSATNCNTNYARKDIAPGVILKNWVQSYRIYSPVRQVKWNGTLYNRNYGACYNVPAAGGDMIAYAKD